MEFLHGMSTAGLKAQGHGEGGGVVGGGGGRWEDDGDDCESECCLC